MKMGKFEIETDDLVYIPSDDTFLLAENLEIKDGDIITKWDGVPVNEGFSDNKRDPIHILNLHPAQP